MCKVSHWLGRHVGNKISVIVAKQESIGCHLVLAWLYPYQLNLPRLSPKDKSNTNREIMDKEPDKGWQAGRGSLEWLAAFKGLSMLL